MRGVCLLGRALLSTGTLLSALPACGSNDRPASVVSTGGQSSQAGHSGQGDEIGNAGEGSEVSGAGGERDDGAAGSAGAFDAPDGPLANYPSELLVDVGCGQAPTAVALVIQNGGELPLTITSVSTDAGYSVTVDVPLTIAPHELVDWPVTAAAPKSDAQLGSTSSGTLSFVTNEPGTPTHHVKLDTTVYGGHLEFVDEDGNALSSLTLTSPSSVECPTSAAYRLHNTGNLAVHLTGPSFPAHIAGTTIGSDGMTVQPDDYASFSVSGVSSPGDACSGGGTLSFAVTGAYCGALPTLNVTWPAGTLTSCECDVPTQ